MFLPSTNLFLLDLYKCINIQKSAFCWSSFTGYTWDPVLAGEESSNCGFVTFNSSLSESSFAFELTRTSSDFIRTTETFLLIILFGRFKLKFVCCYSIVS